MIWKDDDQVQFSYHSDICFWGATTEEYIFTLYISTLYFEVDAGDDHILDGREEIIMTSIRQQQQ
jgi:hypothetical protein